MELIPSFCMTIGCLQYYYHFRMLSAHNPSQDKQLFVSSIQRGQEILTTEFTIFNCPHYIRFLESQIDHKSSHCLWAEYNLAKEFQSQSLLFSIVHMVSSPCMTIACLQYYCQLSTNCQIPGSITSQTAYSMAMKFQSQSLLLSIVFIISNS